MSKRTNFINNLITLVLTFGALFAVVLICDNKYGVTLGSVIGWIMLGAFVAGLVNAFVHELGHLIAGKKNGFKLSCICVWFFKWTRVGKKLKFSLTFPWNEAGYTEMVPTEVDNMPTRYKKMTRGGIYLSLVLALIGAVAMFFTQIPLYAYCLWSMFFPIGLYYFFGNILPICSDGVRNDGAVIRGINKNDDVAKVTIALLQFQAHLFNGKTPCQVDETLLFDLPQLPEDDIAFIMLLDARYNYYLDKKDYENAKKISDRLETLYDYMPKYILVQVQTNLLYNACTFNYNEDQADDLMYEIEDYLNNVNTATTVRVKLAYLLYIEKEKEPAQMFFDKGIRETKKCLMKGVGEFERKLLEQMQKDF